MIRDEASPADRLAAMLEDGAPALLLAVERPAFNSPATALTLSDALTGRGADWQPDCSWDADAPLLIHFTSGSTGRPKGIVLSAPSMLYRGLDASGSGCGGATGADAG